MNEHVYKMIEVVGSSRTGIEDAVNNALSRARESVRHSRWIEVTQIRGQVENNAVAYWQVGLKVGFTVETSPGKETPPEDTKKESSGETKGSGKFRCKVCGYIYDPEKGDSDNGIKPGTPFKDLPADWKCPECGVNKDQFEEILEG